MYGKPIQQHRGLTAGRRNMRIPALSGCLLATLLPSLLPAQARTLKTLFASDNTCADGGVAMFHALVVHQAGLRITALDVNCAAADSQMVTVNVWTTPGHWAGVERNAAAWTLVASGRSWTAPVDMRTTVELPDFVLPSGPWGIAVQTIGAPQACTNGTATNLLHLDAHLLLIHGATLTTQFQASGLLVQPQVWNGAFHYAVPGDGVSGPFGTGCGPVSLLPQGHPSVGQTMTFLVTADHGPGVGTTQGTFGRGGGGSTGPSCFAVLVSGFSNTFGAGQALPFDLTYLGMIGCSLLVDPLVPAALQVLSGVGNVGLQVPNDPRLIWQPLYSQAFLFLSGSNALGVAATNGCEGVIGR
jgi:hypothetical protein